MSNNELERLTICICDYYGITKKDIITNHNVRIPATAKHILIHLTQKHNLMDVHRLAFFLDTSTKVIYKTTRRATSKLLYWKDFRLDHYKIERRFLNKELSIYNQ